MSETTSKTTGKTVPEIAPDRCKHCGICSHFCPAGAITEDTEGRPRLTDPEACTSCRLCEQLCPDFAIEMVSNLRGTAPGETTERPAAKRRK